MLKKLRKSIFGNDGKVDVALESSEEKVELIEALNKALEAKDLEIEKLKTRLEEVEKVSNRRLSDFNRATCGNYKDGGNRKPTAKERELRLRTLDGELSISQIVPPKFVQALVFDCGTSETKPILFTYDETRECQLSLQEIRLDGETLKDKRSGVIDHIMNGTCKRGVIEDFSNLYLKACQIIADKGGKVDFCIVGASAWARKLYANENLTRDKNKLMYDLRENGFFPKIFPQRDESHFELLATVYAFSIAQSAGMIPRHLMFGAVLASGGGSCQYTFFDGSVSDSKGESFRSLNVEIGNRAGLSAFLKTAENDLSDAEAPIEALDKWILATQKQIEIVIDREKQFRKVSGFVLCISAQYFAALEISKVLEDCVDRFGSIVNKDGEANVISAANAIKAGLSYVDQQKKRWRAMTTEERKSLATSKNKRKDLKSFARGIANAYFCLSCWQRYFEPSASLCFKRDWIIGKEKTKFRTTWSAGWFMDILKCHERIDVTASNPQMGSVLKLLETSRELQKKRTIEFRLAHSKIAYFVNDMVASHIGNVPSLVDYHMHIAKTKSAETINWFKSIERILHQDEKKKMKKKKKEEEEEEEEDDDDGTGSKLPLARLVGLDSRLKSHASMERKIHSVIAGLLIRHAANVGDGSYAPLESEIIRGVRDGLRYTLVVRNDGYYKAIRVVETFLEAKGCVIEGKNYWQNPKDPSERKTMYMGINMIILLPPDAHAHHFAEHRYPVELQVHTPESFELKSGVSHDVYEDIRTESVPARRAQLITKGNRIWEAVKVPTDASFDPPCVSAYRGLHGNFVSKRKTYDKRKHQNPIVMKFLNRLRESAPK